MLPTVAQGRHGMVCSMRKEIQAVTFTREQRQRYREKVRQNLDVFEQMLAFSSASSSTSR